MSTLEHLSEVLEPGLEPGETIHAWRAVVGESKISEPTFASPSFSRMASRCSAGTRTTYWL